MADNYDIDFPFLFAKLDIKDRLWRLAVNDDGAWNCCYVLPSVTNNIEDTTIVVPNCLQLGWCESPPFFCSRSETARDVIKIFSNMELLPPHQFEHYMLQKVVEATTHPDKYVSTLF